MSAIIQIQVSGKLYNPDNAEWVDQLLAYMNDLARLSPFQFREIVELVRQGVITNIQQAIDFTGNPLLPLHKSTIKQKKSNKILFATGLLSRSVISTMMGLDTAEITIGSARKQIALWLTRGTKNMVARPFFGISPATDSLVFQYLYNIGYRMVA